MDVARGEVCACMCLCVLGVGGGWRGAVMIESFKEMVTTGRRAGGERETMGKKKWEEGRKENGEERRRKSFCSS